MTVTIDSIVTADANPSASPYKVSNISGHNQATVTFTVSGTGPIQAYKMRQGGSNVTAGAELATLGMVCGMARMGEKSVAMTTPKQFIEPILTTELGGGADGAYPINLYVYRNGVFE